MNEVAQKRFKFGQAAYGIGVTEKTLRNWLQRGQVDLVTERGPDDAHYSFAIADLAVLSVVAELVRYGCPVRTAFDGLASLRQQMAVLTMYKNTPLAAAAASLAAMQVFATNDQDVWNIDLLPNSLSVQDNNDKIGSFVMVSPGFCLSEVLRRLRELQEKASISNEMLEKARMHEVNLRTKFESLILKSKDPEVIKELRNMIEELELETFKAEIFRNQMGDLSE